MPAGQRPHRRRRVLDEVPEAPQRILIVQFTGGAAAPVRVERRPRAPWCTSPASLPDPPKTDAAMQQRSDACYPAPIDLARSERESGPMSKPTGEVALYCRELQSRSSRTRAMTPCPPAVRGQFPLPSAAASPQPVRPLVSTVVADQDRVECEQRRESSDRSAVDSTVGIAFPVRNKRAGWCAEQGFTNEGALVPRNDSGVGLMSSHGLRNRCSCGPMLARWHVVRSSATAGQRLVDQRLLEGVRQGDGGARLDRHDLAEASSAAAAGRRSTG